MNRVSTERSVRKCAHTLQKSSAALQGSGAFLSHLIRLLFKPQIRLSKFHRLGIAGRRIHYMQGAGMKINT